MPNWKKVIISGSDAPVSAITASVVPEIGESAINLLAIRSTGEVVQIQQQDLLQAGNDNLGDHTASAAAGLNMNGLPIYSASQLDIKSSGAQSFIKFDPVGNGTSHSGIIQLQPNASTQGPEITLQSLSGANRDIFLSAGGQDYLHLNHTTNKRLYINPDGLDIDFVAEGNNDDSLLFVNAGTDRVGIGYNSPSQKLSVDGGIYANGNITGSNISASGLLFASASTPLVSSDSILAVVYDTGSGQFYYTGSYGTQDPTFPFEGDAVISGSLTITGSRADGTIFEVYGESTPIFEIIDSYDTLFQINDVSGISRLKVDGSGHTSASRDVVVGENLYIKNISNIGATAGDILVAGSDGKIYYTASVGGGGGGDSNQNAFSTASFGSAGELIASSPTSSFEFAFEGISGSIENNALKLTSHKSFVYTFSSSTNTGAYPSLGEIIEVEGGPGTRYLRIATKSLDGVDIFPDDTDIDDYLYRDVGSHINLTSTSSQHFVQYFVSINSTVQGTLDAGYLQYNVDPRDAISNINVGELQHTDLTDQVVEFRWDKSAAVGNIYGTETSTGTIAKSFVNALYGIKSDNILDTRYVNNVALADYTPYPSSSLTEEIYLLPVIPSSSKPLIAALTASGNITASGTVYANGVQIGTSGSNSNGHLTIWRNSVDKQAVIAFPQFGDTQNDPGMIRHYNSGDTGIMEFSVSDQDGSNDKFVFGHGGYTETAVTPALTITADGNISASGDVNTISAITGAFGLIDGGSF